MPPTEVPLLGYGQFYLISSSPPPSTKQYEVTIGNFPNCTCVDHTNDGKFLGWSRDVGALQTSLFHPAKCDALLPNRFFHSFFDMELE